MKQVESGRRRGSVPPPALHLPFRNTKDPSPCGGGPGSEVGPGVRLTQSPGSAPGPKCGGQESSLHVENPAPPETAAATGLLTDHTPNEHTATKPLSF